MKRLIVCCDGTWQDLEKSYPTNVVKMAQAIQLMDETNKPAIQQFVFYGEGIGTKEIGTGRSLIDLLNSLGGGGLGLGIDHKIQVAYRFLCMNYEPGDEIYLFGFSRGSYTVRCLAGLIYNSGLPRRQFIRKIPQAYEIYREKKKSENKPDGQNAVEFRAKYGERVPIKALCCWDTVASLGIPDLIHSLHLDEKFNERYRFYDSTVNPTIENAIHAVAIDEIRKVFDVTLMEHHESRQPDQVIQVWFPGTHGCIGGGSQGDQGLSDGALQWMVEQVKKLGLVLDENRMECEVSSENHQKTTLKYGIHPDYTIPFDNQPEGIFEFIGTIEREIVGSFADIHESVKLRWHDCPTYRPENLEKRFKTELNNWKPS